MESNAGGPASCIRRGITRDMIDAGGRIPAAIAALDKLADANNDFPASYSGIPCFC